MAQRPVTSQDAEWQVSAAAVIGPDTPDRLHPAFRALESRQANRRTVKLAAHQIHTPSRLREW